MIIVSDIANTFFAKRQVDAHVTDNMISKEQLVLHHTELSQLPLWHLTPRQLCDLELLINGGFAPLQGFLSRVDYEAVLNTMHLANGSLWPMPIVLDVKQEFIKFLNGQAVIGLCDAEGVLLAIMHITDCWQPDKQAEALAVYGTTDTTHPGVAYLMQQTQAIYLGGPVLGVELPTYHDFLQYRRTPQQLKTLFKEKAWQKIVGFQTRNPMHRAHQELTLRAIQSVGANLLLQPVVGLTRPGDVDHFTRVRCYEHLLKYYPNQSAILSLLPLAMRMAGPREAVWHALIRKNYGCTHFIIGRDHAGPGKDQQGNDFYGPYAAQELAKQYQAELGIELLFFQEMVYVQETDRYHAIDELRPNHTALNISGTELRQRLQTGAEIPEWFSYPEIVQELQRTHPPKHLRGLTVFFTGLSGAGKSTLANALIIRLMAMSGRPVTLLDGDLVRKHLSSELGFSKAHRDLNIQRIGYVASEITKHGGIAVCAPIAPYQETRAQVRQLIENVGHFVEVYIATPLDICEQRDRKGLYAKARAGIIPTFSGISDPYEEPANPELMLDTSQISVTEGVAKIIEKLTALGYLRLNA